MTPIQELLSRIRWDKEFGQGCFEIGYYDRHTDSIHRVKFTEVVFPEDAKNTLMIFDESGQYQRIPFHRVREVYKDGWTIWQRPSNQS